MLEIFHGFIILFIGFGYLIDPVIHMGTTLCVLTGWLVCDGCFIQNYQRKQQNNRYIYHLCNGLMNHTPFTSYFMFHLAMIDFFFLFPFWKCILIFMIAYLGLFTDCYLNPPKTSISSS